MKACAWDAHSHLLKSFRRRDLLRADKAWEKTSQIRLQALAISFGVAVAGFRAKEYAGVDARTALSLYATRRIKHVNLSQQHI